MLEVQIPVEIQYKDPETGEFVTVAKKVVNSIDNWTEQLELYFYYWQDNSPKISWLKFYLPVGITIFIDRPCKISADNYIVNLEKEPKTEEIVPV